jgi:hypothetical protein
VAGGHAHVSATPERSSPLAKGDPVLGISGLDPHILAFSTPENAPTQISLGLKKKLGKKKGHKNTTQKKKCEHCLLCWPAGAKKKSRG